jgi:hypothetical protein
MERFTEFSLARVEAPGRCARFSNEHLAGYVQRFSGLTLLEGQHR